MPASERLTIADALRALATSGDARELERVMAAAGMEEALDAAMDVLNVLSHLRRRQRELSGLYATAREHGSGAGAFLPGTDAEELARFVHERLKRELGGGLIVCAAEPQEPAAQMRLAERSAALLHSLGRARVAHLLGDDWQSPDRALELHLALQLRSLADRI